MYSGGKNTKKEKPLHDDGFTIVEIVVVMILMLLAIYPMMRVVASAMEASNEEQYLTHCAFLAQMKMEEMRAKSLCYSDNAQCTLLAGGDSMDWGNGAANFSQAAGACSFHTGFSSYKCEIIDELVVPLGQCQGQANCLKAVRIWVWYDKDGGNDRDSNEPNVYLESFMTSRMPMPGVVN